MGYARGFRLLRIRCAVFDIGPGFVQLRIMIEFSESAVRRVREMQQERSAPDQLLRIFVTAGGCSGYEYGMSFDSPKAGDQRLESGGVEFVIDPKSLERLQGSVVEFDDGLHGKGFEIRNPNAQSTCGCGRSFN